MQQGMHRNSVPALTFASPVFQRDRLGHLASAIGDHGPGEPGNLFGPEPGLDREQEQDTVAHRVARRFEMAQNGGFLFGRENFGLLALRHLDTLKLIVV